MRFSSGTSYLSGFYFEIVVFGIDPYDEINCFSSRTVTWKYPNCPPVEIRWIALLLEEEVGHRDHR